jgi:hypothetical protein
VALLALPMMAFPELKKGTLAGLFFTTDAAQ